MSIVMEKEVRGPIDDVVAKRIEQFAIENKWSVHKYKQISIYCNTDHIERIGTVSGGKGRIIIDIRDNSIKIKLKLGNALSFERKEHTIRCSAGSHYSIAVLFSLLGIEDGFVRTFDRTDYLSPDGVQLTVKQNCLMGDHFELERASDDKVVVDAYTEVIEELGLVLWTKEELAQAIQNDHDRVKAKNICSAIEELL